MKYCKKCGNELKDGDVFCEKCGIELKQRNAPKNTFKLNYVEESTVDNKKVTYKKPKKKHRKVLISCIILLLVIAAVSTVFILRIPQNYIGNPWAEPAVVVEKSDNENGLRFNFDIWELQNRHIVSREKLGLNDDNQYWWLATLADPVDDNHKVFGVDTTYHQYKSASSKINWWFNIFEENNSEKINCFEICMRIKGNKRSEIEEIMQNNINIAISMMNPELGIFKIREISEKLINSDIYDSDGNKTLIYNNIYYEICDEPYRDFYALIVNPISESGYEKLTEGNTAPDVSLKYMSDEEYHDKIMTVLKNTSFVKDYMPEHLSSGACQDMSYGSLISLMFKSPDITVDRTAYNSCTVKISGNYRSIPLSDYYFYGTVYIDIDDVSAGKCSITSSDFISLAKSFALSY